MLLLVYIYYVYWCLSSKAGTPKGQTYDDVKDLMQLCLDIGHFVYMDNFSSSPELFEDLLSTGISASVIVCTN